MITEDYVSFELAKKLSSLKICQNLKDILYFYVNPDCKLYSLDDNGYFFPIVNTPKELHKIGVDAADKEENVFLAPSLSLVTKWLRKEKDIYIVLLPCVKEILQDDFSKCDYFEYRVVYRGSEPYAGYKDTYEEAFIEAIEKALELLNK